jgi:hypothetical protein
VETRYVSLKDDERSTVIVRNRFTGADITTHFNFQWCYVNKTEWTPVPYRTDAEPGGQYANTYQGFGTEYADGGKDGKYLGLKVTAQSGYQVHGDSEFVFGRFTD